MKIRHAVFAVSICALPMACAGTASESEAVTAGASAHTLQLAELPNWIEHLSPVGDELAFETISWIPDFAGGVTEADARQRPLLFWAMNGHPLGCT